MILCAAGDTHGAIDRLYREVLAFEDALRVQFEWVVHVGDFGVWPDPERIDKATRNHEGAGDFPEWYAQKKAAPRRTVFIKGNHEDFQWLDERQLRDDLEVLPNVWFLPNGAVKALAGAEENVRVVGIGGCYGPSDYDAASAKRKWGSQRHFTSNDVEAAGQHGLVKLFGPHQHVST